MGVPLLWGAGCTRQGRKTFLRRGLSVSGNFGPRDTKIGTWVHLDKAYLAQYEERDWGALCTRSARANVLHLFLFCRLTGQTVGTADAKLAGHRYAIPAYMFFWLPFVWGAGCARQERKSLFARGPSVLGNVHLLTPNLVHLWKSMSVIRWCMPLGDGVHSARAVHVHIPYA